MRLFLQLLVIVVFTVIQTQNLYAQAVSLAPFATVSGLASGEQLGTVIRKSTLQSNGSLHLFIGAPGASSGLATNHGRIYLLGLPVESDTSLTTDHVIIEGVSKDEQIGRFFNIADFNGDGNVDVITWNPDFNDESGRVMIFYGPFIQGQIRRPSQANIVLLGSTKATLGSALALVEPIAGSSSSGFIVGAAGLENFTGKAFYFKNIDKLRLNSSLSEADVVFNGEYAFEVFGETIQSLGDINGDGELDVAISATKHTFEKALQGATYIFFGPFNKASYTLFDANITLFGRNQGTLWAGRITAHGDINNDGKHDFSLGSDGDGNGTLALFYGRENWADSIRIGTATNAQNQHSIFTGSGAGFGFSTDFSGDYNDDGNRDFVFGAPYTNSRIGSVIISNTTGGGQVVLTNATTSSDGLLGTQVLHLGNINTIEKDPYGVDDIVVSAPGAVAPVKFGQIRSGVLTFLTGRLNPPTSALSISSGFATSAIGDSARVLIASNRGSKALAFNRLKIVYNERGFAQRIDSVDLQINSNSAVQRWFKLKNAGTIVISHLVKDQVGIEASSMITLTFGAVPAPFNLLSEFLTTTEIGGDRTKTVQFTSEASADTNGASIRYELLFATEESAFETGSGFNLISTSANPTFTMSYQDLNAYLINNGFLTLNQVNRIYWTIRARNLIAGTPLFNRLASNGPRAFPFVRKGLDPFFDVTSGTNRNLFIEGYSTDFFEFKWSSLVSENPNAVVDYRFVLLRDTTISGKANPIIREYTDPTLSNTHRIIFEDLKFILEENNVFNLASTDSVTWYYTIEAIIDGQESSPWLARQRYKKATIKYLVMISSIKEEELISELPTDFELYPNYPNPFNPSTQIKFALPEAKSVKISVFNLLGQTVYSWQSSGLLSAGFHEHTLSGASWSSGIYIYQIQAGNERLTGKMSLIK